MTAEAKPVAMQPNPAYGVGIGQDTTMATNTELANPTYDVAVMKDIVSATNVGAVAMQSNPAYSAMIRGETIQSESETDCITIL